MSGQRHVMDSIGNTYEDFVEFLMGRFTGTIRVPGKKDFGADFYCLPRLSNGSRTETAVDLCSLQVKGGTSELEYGGLNYQGEWKEHEIEWLRSLTAPLYLARVDPQCSTVDLFSLWPAWWVLLQAGNPFRIVLRTEPASSEVYQWSAPESRSDSKAVGINDGMVWNVNLGPPVLQLTNENLRGDAFRAQACTILRTWTQCDRLTLIRFLQGVPVIDSIARWRTNSTVEYGISTHQFWNTAPGANIPRLCRTLAPVITNLGVHLQWQKDGAAYRLIPILDWLDEQKHLDDIGRGLLGSLRETRR